MGRYDEQETRPAREADHRYDNMGAGLRNAVASAECTDDRSATEKADALANMLESAAERLEDVATRLGYKGDSPLKAGNSVPRPPRQINASLADGNRWANRIQEAIEFMLRAL